MFSIKHNECVGFESKWKVTKITQSNFSQTTEFSVSEKETQSVITNTQEVQTDNSDEIIIKTNNPNNEEAEMEKLAQWLNKIYPKVKEQIDASNNSKAFRNYRLLGDSVDSTCKFLQNLIVVSKNELEKKAIPKISGLEWNNIGKSLAVTYNYKHTTCCHHPGVVIIYNLMRDGLLNDSPKKRLSTDSCVTSLKFHPTHSSILAAGTFNGRIYIWNCENDVDSLIENIITEHNEFITQISWIQNVEKERSISLVSSSTDNLMKLWNFDNELILKSIFKIRTPVLAQINPSREISQELSEKVDLGILCFDFSKHIPDMFVVALEGGLLARCSTLGMIKIKTTLNNNNNISIYDPVFKYYETLKGEIVEIKFSPQRKDIFLTNSTDGEIRIYLIDQEEPAQIIFTKSILNEISFIPHEEKLLVGCGQNGLMEIYNLINGQPLMVEFNEKIIKRNLTSLAINSVKTDFIAMGNINGEVHLWKVPWQNIQSKFVNQKIKYLPYN